jgi:hypothetical protein
MDKGVGRDRSFKGLQIDTWPTFKTVGCTKQLLVKLAVIFKTNSFNGLRFHEASRGQYYKTFYVCNLRIFIIS